MRKLLAFVLCLIVICCAFAGCGGNGSTTSDVSSSQSSSDKQTTNSSATESTTSTSTSSTETSSNSTESKPATKPAELDNDFVALKPDKNSTEYFVKLDRPDAVYDILVIGDENYKSALRYVSTIADYQNYQINLGCATIAETSTEYQLDSLKNNRVEYGFSISDNIKLGEHKDLSLADILKQAEWEYVILTHSSANAGKAAAYAKFDDFVKEIKAKIPAKAKILWSTPWGFTDSCESQAFKDEYNNSAKDMLEAINTATAEYPKKNSNISGIIDIAGIFSKINANGEYLEKGEQIKIGCGQYAVSLALFVKGTGYSLDKIKWYSPCTDKQFKAITAALK